MGSDQIGKPSPKGRGAIGGAEEPRKQLPNRQGPSPHCGARGRSSQSGVLYLAGQMDCLWHLSETSSAPGVVVLCPKR